MKYCQICDEKKKNLLGLKDHHISLLLCPLLFPSQFEPPASNSTILFLFFSLIVPSPLLSTHSDVYTSACHPLKSSPLYRTSTVHVHWNKARSSSFLFLLHSPLSSFLQVDPNIFPGERYVVICDFDCRQSNRHTRCSRVILTTD